MAFMLIGITLFFVMVALFLLSTTFSGLKSKAQSLEEKEALLMVSKIANSPEFACGESFGSQRVNCVDTDKLMGIIDKKEEYKSFWEADSIEIRKLGSDEEIECTLTNYPDCNFFNIHSSSEKGGDSSIFVSLCKRDLVSGRTYDKCELGRIFVGF